MTREQKLDALLRLFDAYLVAVAQSPMAQMNGCTHWATCVPPNLSNSPTLAECMTLGDPGIPGFNDEDWIELP